MQDCSGADAGCVSGRRLTGRADVVTEWNEIADSMTAVAPPLKNRIMAMVQVAVHDALNAVDRRYESYTGIPGAPSGASPGAAVAADAYRVLRRRRWA